MKIKDLLLTLLVVIVILFIQRECSRDTVITDPEVTIEYIYDSIPVEKIVEVPVPYKVIYTEYDTIIKTEYLPVDTVAILRDYFAFRIYKDTIIDTEDLRVVLRDTIHQNRIWSERVVSYQNFRPIDVNVQVECPTIRNKWFIGGNIGGSPEVFGAGPSLSLVTKKDNMYHYNYDIINNVHSIGLLWKITFR